jgi:hypothetical protein
MHKYRAVDKGYVHRDGNGKYPSNAEMHQIYRRIFVANEQYYKRPPYSATSTLRPDLMIEGDDLTRFKPSCICTVARAVSDQISHAVTPYWKHASTPATADDLAGYCPCSLRDAA